LSEINSRRTVLFSGWLIEVENKGSTHSKANSLTFATEPSVLSWPSIAKDVGVSDSEMRKVKKYLDENCAAKRFSLGTGSAKE
jgi:hypothetical protein